MEPRMPVLPVGPWTKQLRDVPRLFTEDRIRERILAAGASKHLTAGYRMFKANKVQNILLHKDSSGQLFIKAGVEASMTLHKKYLVHSILQKNGDVTSALCTCPSGKGGVCKHVVAQLWHVLDLVREGHTFIPDTLACTNEPRKWGPSASKRAGCRLHSSTSFAL